MKRALIIAGIWAVLTASVWATIFVVADQDGATMSFRNDEFMKLTITSTKLAPVTNDPNSIELIVRLKVN